MRSEVCLIKKWFCPQNEAKIILNFLLEKNPDVCQDFFHLLSMKTIPNQLILSESIGMATYPTRHG